MGSLRVLKNHVLLNVGCLLFFSAFEGLINLQSTMNAEKGVGVLALAVKYAFLLVCCMVLPTLLIKKLGCKFTLTLGTLGFLPYTVANFYPQMEVFIPAAALCGISAAAFWPSRATYINAMSCQYALEKQNSPETATALWFGVSSMFYSVSYIIGNAISYLILKPAKNATVEVIDVESLSSCGARFCNDVFHLNTSYSNLEPPSDAKRYLLSGVFTICVALSAVIFYFGLDAVSTTNIEAKVTKKINLALVFAAIFQLRSKSQLCLLPITMHLGLSNGFLFSEFTKAYVGCTLGIYHIGFAMMVYGIMNAVMSMMSGSFVKYLGLTPALLCGAVVDVALYIALLVWNPRSASLLTLSAIAAAWGFGDGIWWPQLHALYGNLYKNDEEAAFSNFYFWSSTGFLTIFILEPQICTYIKLYILIFILILGAIGVFLIIKVTGKKPLEENSDQNTERKNIYSNNPDEHDDCLSDHLKIFSISKNII